MIDLNHVADPQAVMFKNGQAILPGIAGLRFKIVGDVAVKIHADLTGCKGDFGIFGDFDAMGVGSARQGHFLGVKGTIFHGGFLRVSTISSASSIESPGHRRKRCVEMNLQSRAEVS